MGNELKKAESCLYSRMPKHVQQLHQRAKKLGRDQKRTQWKQEQARQSRSDFLP